MVRYRMVPGTHGTYRVGSDGSVWSWQYMDVWHKLKPNAFESGSHTLHIQGHRITVGMLFARMFPYKHIDL
jgi:hypothetical protein